MATKSAQGTAIVTGASSGIGEVYAERLADRGYDLVLVARRQAELEKLAASIASRTGRKVDFIVADLATSEGQALVEQRLRDDGAVTLLVNNAGASATGPIVGGNADDTEQMLMINILALTRLSAAAAYAFAARKAGAIVNISSVMSVIITPRTAGYAASKAYVLNFSRALAEELAPLGVHVQAVLPGYTRTPFLPEQFLASLPPEIVMDVDDLVDAALVGLDKGETITIPPLHNIGNWDAFEAARQKLVAEVGSSQPAERYRVRQVA